MKAPDVIYVEFSEEVNLAFEKQPFEETPAYIRKDRIREMVMLARNMSQTPDAAIHNWDVLIKEIDKL